MKVKELIEQLQQLNNQDLMVVVRGYEGGVDDVDSIGIVHLKLDANTEWYYGQHDDNYKSDEEHQVQAIQLSGYNKIMKRE